MLLTKLLMKMIHISSSEKLSVLTAEGKFQGDKFPVSMETGSVSANTFKPCQC